MRAPTTAARAQTDSAAHVTKLDALNGYLHHHAVPRHLQQRVLSYMGYVWASHRGGTLADEVEALATLPVTIQLDLAVATKLPLIERCPFFDFCSRDVHRALAAALATLRFATGDIIVQHGDLGAEMYFLVSGHVEVRVRCGGRQREGDAEFGRAEHRWREKRPKESVQSLAPSLPPQVLSSDRSTVLATLDAGAFFGEQALFYRQQRTATIRAADFCEILVRGEFFSGKMPLKWRGHQFFLFVYFSLVRFKGPCPPPPILFLMPKATTCTSLLLLLLQGTDQGGPRLRALVAELRLEPHANHL